LTFLHLTITSAKSLPALFMDYHDVQPPYHS
jgi:hypothetical protein